MGSVQEHGTFNANADPNTNTSFLHSALDRIPHPTAALHNIRKPITVGAILLACTLRATPALAQQELPTEHETDEQHTENADNQAFEESETSTEATQQLLYPTGPSGNAFYEAPDDLPANNGDVIWQRETTFMPTLVERSNARAWKILYRSSTATGEPTVVSGTILAPPESAKETSTPRPLILFAPGTQGMADHCASSKLMEQGLSYEGPVLKELLKNGYAVGITDYPGLGTEGEHTYVVGRANGPAVLDMGRAALNFPQAGLAAESSIGIWGYSEGGGAAVWAAQLQDSYAPELHVKGVAAGGIPADLKRVADWVEKGKLFYGLQPMAAVGLNQAYPELQLESILTDKGKRERDIIRSSCLLDGLARTAFGRASQATIVNIFKLPNWKLRLDENKAGKIAFNIPVYMYHGLLDEAVPFDQAKALRDAYCRMGMPVKWDTIMFAEHIIGLYYGAGRALRFMQQSLNDNPPPANCRQRRQWWR